MTDYGDLKISELVKMVNDEYAAIIDADRSNLQRALKVGEMLVDLKPRVARHGEWQLWLRNHCPKISIETANLYMRLADNLDELEKRAGAKSVSLTDLTITEARKLLATPKSGTGKSTNASRVGGVEPGNEPPASTVTLESFLENTAPDELFATLKDKYEEDQLRALAKLLVDHLTSAREAA
jgi:Protein of unknown function (DUF3102)